jgi:catechol 2,3-dioxygenase-like lactoylglutathione lyase family enzyme
MAKLNYVTVGSNDLEKAKAFYDGLLGSIGMKPLHRAPVRRPALSRRRLHVRRAGPVSTAIRPASATA